MSIITNPKYDTLTLRDDGTFSSGNSSQETINAPSYGTVTTGITAAGSSNSSINDDYTENGTHNSEPAYEGNNGWIYYANGFWCWNVTKTTLFKDAAYRTRNKLGVYREKGGVDTFEATDTTTGVSTEWLNCEIAYISEFIIDDLIVGSCDFYYDDYLHFLRCSKHDITHNGEDVFDIPATANGSAIAFNSGVESYATINSSDFAGETTGEDGSWIPSGPVQVAGSTKTPNTYTNNIIGITDANTVHICGWQVTAPSEASRYPTETLSDPKDYELWFDENENTLKIYTPDSLTNCTVYNNTWLRLSYNFPSFKPMYNDAYVDGYKLALSRTAGDLKQFPLNNITVNAITLNGSASAQLHSGAGLTVNGCIVLTGFEDSGAGGNCAVIDLSDNSYTSIDQTSWNTSNGVVAYDGKTLFYTTNIGGCQYFEPNPTSNSDITGVDANGTANNEWLAITCGPTAGNTVYGLLFNSTANETYIVKQSTYPSIYDTDADYTINTQAGELWRSMSMCYTSNIYGLPSTENGFVLKINTTNDAVTTINCGNCPAVRQTILAPNGLMYGFPDDYSANVIRFDPSDETITLLAATGGTTNETRHQGYCGADGRLYIFPDDLDASAETIIFDPVTETSEIVELPNETTEDYLTILPGPPGIFYRLDNQGKYMHIIKFYHTAADYDDYWKYTHFNPR